MAGPFRSVVLIALVLLATVAVAVTVALVASPDEPEQYPAGSPEAAVQRYLQALRDHEIEQAYDMLSSSIRQETTIEEFRDRTRFGIADDQSRRVRLGDVDITGDRAFVRLTVDRVSGGGIDFDRYSYQRTVPLVRENGDWRIDDLYAGIAVERDADMAG